MSEREIKNNSKVFDLNKQKLPFTKMGRTVEGKIWEGREGICFSNVVRWRRCKNKITLSTSISFNKLIYIKAL